jgi:hypothetical protein
VDQTRSDARPRRVVVLGVAIVAAAMVLASPAIASKRGDSFIGTQVAGTSGGLFNFATDVASYQGTGANPGSNATYVVDSANHRIQRFDADGNFQLAWGRNVIKTSPTGGSTDLGDVFEVCAVAVDCQAGSSGTSADGPAGELDDPQGIAVDQDTGDVYVADRDNRRVQVFDKDGNWKRMWGWDVVATDSQAIFEVCAVEADCKIGVAGSSLGQFGSGADSARIAVSPPDGNAGTGKVLAADPGNRRGLIFNLDGTSPAAIGSSADFASSSPLHVALDSGTAYLGDGGIFDRPIRRYDLGTNAFLPSMTSQALGGVLVGAVTLGMEVDSSTGRLLVTRDVIDGDNASEAADTLVQELSTPAATPSTHDTHMHGSGDIQSSGLGVNTATGDLFAAIGHRVLVLDDDGALPLPVLTIAPPSDIGAHTATFNGSVNPNGPAGISTEYRFEYSKNGIDWTAVAAPAAVGDGTSAVMVDDATAALEANAFYRVRIVATRAFDAGSATSAELTFLTDAPPPEVTTGSAQRRASTSVELLGRINPNNMPTTYRFEYGKTPSYGLSAPVVPASAGAGGVEMPVIQALSGLDPDTTYHYRIVASNAQGTTEGDDRVFRTLPAVAPPRGRAYEMVTPANKNNREGGEPRLSELAAANPGMPSSDGESLLFGLRNGILESDAGTGFPHQDDMVVIRRGTSGWKAEAVQDVPGAESASLPTNFIVGTAADLETQAWQHAAFLFPSGAKLSTWVAGDTTGLNGSGWHEWNTAPIPVTGVTSDRALVDDGGDRILRWLGSPTRYRGLLGAGDPSNGQRAGAAGGDAPYLQEPPGTGPLTLLSACTGTGSDATLIPERDDNGTGFPNLADDKIDAQSCATGAVTSTRGATVGAGGADISGNAATGGVARAMSEDGSRTFFMSPDPHATGVPTGQCAAGVIGSGPSGPITPVGPNTDCTPQLYVRQIGSDGQSTVRWVSRTRVAGQAINLFGRGAIFEGASSDGRVVYFRTNAPLVEGDPNGGSVVAGGVKTGSASNDSWDLYRYELPEDLDLDPADGLLTRVSGGPSGTADPATHCGTGTGCNSASAPPGTGAAARYVSDDGRRVYFATTSPIAGADTTAPDGGVTTPGGAKTSNTSERNLYIYDANGSGADAYRFVARLPYSGSGTHIDACATRNAVSGMPESVDSDPAGRIQRWPVNCVRGTPAGDVVVFETTGRLTGDDDDSASDIYLYNATTDELARVSATPLGTTPYVCANQIGGAPEQRCNADLGFQGPTYDADERVGLGGQRHTNIAIDGEGEVSVYFETRLPLVSEDTNGDRMDVYEWRAGVVSLISPGGTDDDAWYSGNSLDGEDVFFQTSQRIDPREVEDADFDIYDARAGGGFPVPPTPKDPCQVHADSCQGAGVAPLSPGVASDAIGGGNTSLEDRVSLVLSPISRKARQRAAQTGVIPLRIRTTASGRVVARIRTRMALDGKSAGRMIAFKSIRVRTPGTRVLRLRLNRQAMRRIRSVGVIRVTVSVEQRGARPQADDMLLRRAER